MLPSNPKVALTQQNPRVATKVNEAASGFSNHVPQAAALQLSSIANLLLHGEKRLQLRFWNIFLGRLRQNWQFQQKADVEVWASNTNWNFLDITSLAFQGKEGDKATLNKWVDHFFNFKNFSTAVQATKFVGTFKSKRQQRQRQHSQIVIGWHKWEDLEDGLIFKKIRLSWLWGANKAKR